MKMMSWSRYHCLSGSLLRNPRRFSRRDVELLGVRKWKRQARFTSPMERGRREASGEGLQSPLDRNPSPQPSPDGRGGILGLLRGFFQFVIRLFRT
jgi:hypothetical protein